MEIGHGIIIAADDKISHAMVAKREIDAKYHVLSGPFSLPFLSYSLVALSQAPISSSLKTMTGEMSWSLKIVDDLAKKPLITDCTEARALFWLGELVGSLDAGFRHLALDLLAIRTCVSDNTIHLDFASLNNPHFLGALMCAVAMTDALLFARGLVVKESHLRCELADDKRDIFLNKTINNILWT